MSTSPGVQWWRFSPLQILEKIAAFTFDRRHGTDTSGFAELSTVGVASVNKLHGQRYQPSPVSSLRRLLGRLGIDYPAFSLIDFGSGKGRTLLIAGELPFQQVIGVEFGAELHVRAEHNIACYRRRRARSVTSVHADATSFDLPPTDLVLYFFNPFSQAVFDQVAANLLASLKARPRRVILIYLYLPDEAWLLQLTGFVQRPPWRNYVVLDYMPSSF